MFYSTTTNTYIQEGTPFTINDVNYPANWLNLSTPEEKQSIGLEEVIATNSPANDQYYWVSQELNGASLTYINTPKNLVDVQANAVSQINSTAYSLLLPSDWMVVKATETGGTVPAAWNTWRQTIRTEAKDAVNQVNQATTVDQVASAVQVSWTPDPDQVLKLETQPIIEETTV